ncbi:ABC transporter permease [Pseudochelatococcus contaminans]|uniref:Peptide/nickel transport system permease protein n=1 Tax=Pseudochelatococcus contaminans TaxID=1538103 RepID=A0A7W5Z4Y2_9HYPH|nr:ABC transporter permease [Pseudochelatococcus contaminans]MBB3810278.1 peptide/nickel transport system permease protein [Pseudochelatococcus contaminans]
MVRRFGARLIQSVILLWIVSIVGFSLLYLTPGGPLAMFAETPGMTQEDVERLERQLGLDQPAPIQYLRWAGGLVVGDWGRSYRDDSPVLEVIGSRIGQTFKLMLAATAVAMSVGLATGILGAVRQYGRFDRVTTILTMIALSIPTFWFGLLVIYVFSQRLGWIPPGNAAPVGDDSWLSALHHLIGPALVLGLLSTAVWSRYMRSAVLETLAQDYIRTARAKGVLRSRLLFHHVLRNALLPMITLIGLELPSLFGGALVTETVFTWPGMGRLFFDSISYRDYPVILGMLIFSAILVISSNLIADTLYGVADPRLRRR